MAELVDILGLGSIFLPNFFFLSICCDCATEAVRARLMASHLPSSRKNQAGS